MKTEAEIRKHRDNLRKLVSRPCDCDTKDGRHQVGCYVGGKMMAAVIAELSWVLNENEEHGRMVEGMNSAAKEL